ncbi:MAG TPA: FAD-dependent oxidoreductase [Gemmatimonadales bacterium]|nr:FAD-dependent oxidoreductase [Gemmatimonadales bacterium]
MVAGAGIAGLAAAWELTRQGVADVLVLESERRAGGIIVTEQVDGFIVEGGPDGFLAGEPELPALAAELGIADRLVDQQARGTALWNGTALAPLDEGRAAALLGIDATKAEVAAGFRSFARGLAEPVAALVDRLAGTVKFAQGISGLVPTKSRWHVAVTGGSAHDADGIVLALPAYMAGRLLEAAGASHARELAETPYLPTITVSLAYREAQLTRPLTGAGFVVESPQQLRACTFSWLKFPDRAPSGHALLRAYLPPQDGDPARMAHAQLAAILGIRGEPLWMKTYYWNRGLPRYRAHHSEQVAGVRRRLERLPPVAIAGAGYDGAGVSACVRSGRAAARLIVQRMAR